MPVADKWKRFLRELIGDHGPPIRPMAPSDAKEVIRIVKLHDSDDAKAARAYFKKADFDADYELSRHFVLLDKDERGEERIVGVSGYDRDSSLEAEGVYWLGWTYVNPYFRGRGHGARLVHIVVEHVRRFGARKLYLDTSSTEKYAGAVRFYQRCGFAEEGRLTDYYRDGEHMLIMGMRL